MPPSDASLMAWLTPGDVGGAVHFGHDVHQRHVGGWARRTAMPSMRPCTSGMTRPVAPGRSGGGGDHRHRPGARPAQVLVRLVQERLAVGVGVDGGDQAAAEAEAVVQHLDHRGQAVGGAARVGDDVVAVGVVGVVVDAEHQGDVDVLAGRAHDHLAGAGCQWRPAPSRSRKKPVDSTTTSTPSSPQGRLPGSRSANTRISPPSTTRPLARDLDPTPDTRRAPSRT